MGRELQTLNQQKKLEVWSKRISSYRDSGQSVKTWCRDNNICQATFYKFKKKLFEIVNHRQTRFAEVTSLAQSGSVLL